MGFSSAQSLDILALVAEALWNFHTVYLNHMTVLSVPDPGGIALSNYHTSPPSHMTSPPSHMMILGGIKLHVTYSIHLILLAALVRGGVALLKNHTYPSHMVLPRFVA